MILFFSLIVNHFSSLSSSSLILNLAYARRRIPGTGKELNKREKGGHSYTYTRCVMSEERSGGQSFSYIKCSSLSSTRYLPSTKQTTLRLIKKSEPLLYMMYILMMRVREKGKKEENYIMHNSSLDKILAVVSLFMHCPSRSTERRPHSWPHHFSCLFLLVNPFFSLLLFQ